MDMNDIVVKMIIKARVGLLFSDPFFGSLATRLNIVDASKWCKTFASDGKHFFYNREYIKLLTQEELTFIFGHAIMHCVFDHIGRRGGRDKKLWDMATDYLVNFTLKSSKIGSAPKGILYDSKFDDTMTSEEIYKILEKNSQNSNFECKNPIDSHLFDDDPLTLEANGKGSNGNPDPGSKTGVDYTQAPPVYNDSDLAAIRNDLIAAIVSSSQINTGNLPAAIQRMLRELTDSTINWKELLTNSIQSCIRDDYSFQRPSRRSGLFDDSIGLQAIMPGSKNMETIDICISLDTSGSIGDEKFAAFLSEVCGIIEQYQDYRLHIWCIDAAIYNHQVFTPNNCEEIKSYKAFGGGGNDFPLNWKYMVEKEIVPELFVVFSDGYPCGSWGDPNYCDTIFVIANEWDKKINAPFGRTVYMED